MLRATADEITRAGAPHGCMLILAAAIAISGAWDPLTLAA
jgi:hypothetical protein